MPRGKQSRYPMLLGKPSPGLAKIAKMTTEELSQRVESLTLESDNVVRKIGRLTGQDPRPRQRIHELTMLLNRLSELEQAARDRLTEIESGGGTIDGTTGGTIGGTTGEHDEEVLPPPTQSRGYKRWDDEEDDDDE